MLQHPYNEIRRTRGEFFAHKIDAPTTQARLRDIGADEWVIEETLASVHQEDHNFFQNALAGMAKYETKWEAEGFVYSWIDTYPVWISAADWYDYGDTGFPPTPTKSCRRIIRFSLIGGGQVRVVEQWADCPIDPDDLYPVQCVSDPKLVVSGHTDQELRRYSGHLSHGAICEMATYAVVFGANTPQDIADRTAATLRAIDNTPDNFYALLDGSSGCAFCRRPLTDEISKLVGVGPDCAKQNRIPHNLAAANKRLELRRKLLGA